MSFVGVVGPVVGSVVGPVVGVVGPEANLLFGLSCRSREIDTILCRIHSTMMVSVKSIC